MGRAGGGGGGGGGGRESSAVQWWRAGLGREGAKARSRYWALALVSHAADPSRYPARDRRPSHPLRRATLWCSPSWPAPRACTPCSRDATRRPRSSSQRRARRVRAGGRAWGRPLRALAGAGRAQRCLRRARASGACACVPGALHPPPPLMLLRSLGPQVSPELGSSYNDVIAPQVGGRALLWALVVVLSSGRGSCRRCKPHTPLASPRRPAHAPPACCPRQPTTSDCPRSFTARTWHFTARCAAWRRWGAASWRHAR